MTTDELDDLTPSERAPAAPAYTVHADLVAPVGEVPEGAIVSRPVHQDDDVKAMLFGFAPGQELAEHTSSKPAILQVLAGEGRFGFGAHVHPVGPGSWAHLAPSVPYSVAATTPLVLLLTMLKRGG